MRCCGALPNVMTEFLSARTPAEIGALAERVAVAESVAFDTEFLWERSYWPQLCLVQVAIDGLEAVADPVDGGDVTSLWEAIASAPLVIVHAGEHDLGIMHDQIGRLPERIFDTQIAAAFLGWGDSVGHSSLVEALLKRLVKGGEGYTDWAQRPLSSAQIEYAVEDVRHLHDLWRNLADELKRRGRTEWVDEEIQQCCAGIGVLADPREMWRRVKGSNRLNGRALAVLQEITAWREEEARRRDETRRRLVSDQVLIEIARRAPTDPAQISRMRGLHPGQARKYAGPLAEVVGDAVRLDERDWPRRAQRPPYSRDPRIDPVALVLHGVLRMQANALDLGTGLLGTRGDLEELVRRYLAAELDGTGPPLPMLEGWRRAAIGNDLLRLLEGGAAVRIDFGEPVAGLTID